jgi:SAM-dependent methyltransferase
MNELFYEVFSNIPRQGPGDAESTQRAASRIPELPKDFKILDIGCGTGKQTLELVKYFGGPIYAIDNHQPYLDELSAEARKKGFEDEIFCTRASMLDQGFVKGKYDLIWAEGSIFIIGFEEGLKFFKSLLKPNAYMAITEANWIKPNPPTEIVDFWEREYPAITNIENNLKTIESLNYKLIDHFILPQKAWWENFYVPLEKRLKKLYKKYHEDEDSLELLDMIQLEVDMYRKYGDYYGYVFYIMQNKKN